MISFGHGFPWSGPIAIKYRQYVIGFFTIVVLVSPLTNGRILFLLSGMVRVFLLYGLRTFEQAVSQRLVVSLREGWRLELRYRATPHHATITFVVFACFVLTCCQLVALQCVDIVSAVRKNESLTYDSLSTT